MINLLKFFQLMKNFKKYPMRSWARSASILIKKNEYDISLKSDTQTLVVCHRTLESRGLTFIRFNPCIYKDLSISLNILIN